MKLIHKNILRTALLTSYVMVIIAVIFGINAVFRYLNTDAGKSKMLHTEIRKNNQYTPKVFWEPLDNEGLGKEEIGKPMLDQIKINYLDAWYARGIAYKTNTTTGLKDYYTQSARKNLFKNIKNNKLENIIVDATTLEHHLNLNFFSTDKKLAVITDKNVVEYKRIYKGEDLILETTEIATYKLIFLLEDGFWKIRHCVREEVAVYNKKLIPISGENLKMKGVNYYPQATP